MFYTNFVNLAVFSSSVLSVSQASVFPRGAGDNPNNGSSSSAPTNTYSSTQPIYSGTSSSSSVVSTSSYIPTSMNTTTSIGPSSSPWVPPNSTSMSVGPSGSYTHSHPINSTTGSGPTNTTTWSGPTTTWKGPSTTPNSTTYPGPTNTSTWYGASSGGHGHPYPYPSSTGPGTPTTWTTPGTPTSSSAGPSPSGNGTINCSGINFWQRNVAYNSGAQVVYNNNLWTATQWVYNNNPGDSSQSWFNNGTCSSVSPPSVPCDGVSDWQRNTAYNKGQQVKYYGHVWNATQWTENNSPGDSSGSWLDVGNCPNKRDGSWGGGNPPSTCSALPWQNNIAYVQGNQVVSNGNLYTANQWNYNSPPGNSAQAWTFVSPCSSPPPPATCTGIPAWVQSTAYQKGAQVTHNGHLWVAVQWTSSNTPGDTSGTWSDKGACSTWN